MTKEIFVVKENKPPTADYEISTLNGNILTQFYLNAWPSHDDIDPPSLLLVRWDFEGDGNWDTGWTEEKEFYHQYNQAGEYWLTLQVIDQGDELGIIRKKVGVSEYRYETGFIKDVRDGKYYGTVKIDNQWWMSDNLDFEINWKLDIPMLQIYWGWEGVVNKSFGALYQGERSVSYTNAGKNICPNGWRPPTRNDWQELIDHLPKNEPMNSLMVGGKTGFNAQYTGYGSFVFDILNGRVMDTIYYFKEMKKEVRYLSLTTRPSYSTLSQYYFGAQYNFPGVNFTWGDLDGYYYVRCIRDDE